MNEKNIYLTKEEMLVLIEILQKVSITGIVTMKSVTRAYTEILEELTKLQENNK